MLMVSGAIFGGFSCKMFQNSHSGQVQQKHFGKILAVHELVLKQTVCLNFFYKRHLKLRIYRFENYYFSEMTTDIYSGLAGGRAKLNKLSPL